MKNGDIVSLDSDFNNASRVKLISLDKFYSLVQDVQTKELHEVMTNRLSEIEDYDL